MALDLNPQQAGRVLLLSFETFEETEAQEVGRRPGMHVWTVTALRSLSLHSCVRP